MKNILMNENNIGIIKLYEKKEISIMCGIIGYIGHKKASPILINGLLRLEYRGYDSAGISTVEKNGLSIMKDM